MSDFQLVGPEFLAERFARPDAEGPCVVLEAHFTSIDHPLDPDRPNSVHIPGAIQVHPSYLEAGTNREKYYPFYDCPADGNLLPHHELTGVLERIGISPETLVVVYGTEPDGPMAAARVVWGLIYAGVKNVRLLDGGIDAWAKWGGQMAESIEKALEIGGGEDNGVESESRWVSRPEVIATVEDVQTISESPRTAAGKLVDVRKVGEWDGTCTDYYTFFTDAGHIPNSHFQGDWKIFLDSESRKIGSELDVVAQHWKDLGIIDAGVESGETELIFYCGTGWRSSLSFLVAQLLGFRARNFDDGFYGWSSCEGNRIAYGDSPSRKCKAGVPVGSPLRG
ncbi:MAG: rhodanese-like domain-containing protein [Verrucomicrobiales bacterium]|nr:rhodanese-like domain-containing protein [Verrucomicrobiales bacterium]